MRFDYLFNFKHFKTLSLDKSEHVSDFKTLVITGFAPTRQDSCRWIHLKFWADVVDIHKRTTKGTHLFINGYYCKHPHTKKLIFPFQQLPTSLCLFLTDKLTSKITPGYPLFFLSKTAYNVKVNSKTLLKKKELVLETEVFLYNR